jgi:hypothetical protein
VQVKFVVGSAVQFQPLLLKLIAVMPWGKKSVRVTVPEVAADPVLLTVML